MKSLPLRCFVTSATMVLMAVLVVPTLQAATALVSTTTDVVEGGFLEVRLDLQSMCGMSTTQDNIIVSIEYFLNGIDPSMLTVASTSGMTALKIDGFDSSQGVFLEGQFAPANGATSHTAIIRVAVGDDSEISGFRSMQTLVNFLDSGMSFPQGVNCVGGNGFEDLDPPFSVFTSTIISENDLYQVRVSDARDVIEGDSGLTAAVFTVSVSPPISNVLRGGTTTPIIEVQFGTDSAGLTPEATAGSDYQQVTGIDTLTVGKSSFEVSVPVAGDTLQEPDEYFSLFIASGTGTNIPTTVVDGQGDARIVDDDSSLPALEITVTAPDMPEGDSGTTAFPFEVALSRPIDSSESIVSLSYQTVPGTAALQDDFLATTGTLEFQFGSFTTATIEVPVVGDDVEELDETFSLEISVQQGVATVGGGGSFEATIRNDDQAPVELTFVSSRYTASESGGRATIRVARSGPSVGAVSVLARTNLKGTATAGEDYRAASARLEWADGDSADKFLEVSILDDNESEDEEGVGLVLKSPSGAILGAIPSATLRILDQDEAANIEVVGDSMVALRPGTEIELEAKVTDEAGSPIAGEQVMWTLVAPLTGSSTADGGEASGDTKIELIGGEFSISDSEGVARKRVSLGVSAGSFQVLATLPGNPDPAVFDLVVGDLMSLFDPDTGERSVAEVLDSSCRSQDSNFRELCGYLFSLENDDERRAVIREIVPREVASQGVHTLDLMVGQLRTIGTRIASVRKGQNSQVDSQVAMQLGDDVIQSQALEALARATLAGNTSGSSAGNATAGQRRLAAAIDRALDRTGDSGTSTPPLAKGVQDDPALEALEKPERWGFFVNGRYSTGDRRDTARGAGFDFDSLGVTVAVDYRLDDRFLVGAAAGFLDTSSDVVRDGGGLEADNKSLTLYASGAWKRTYVDAIVLYGRNDYALTRNIDLPRPYVSADSSLNGISRFVALSDTSGDQLALNASYGFDVATGMTNLSLFARGYYLSSTIDAFTERGAGPFNLVIQDQDLDSLLGEAGLDLTFNVSLGWGVLQPAIRASYLHEFEDDARQIRAQFQADPALTTFVLPTDFPDSGFVNLGVSLTAVLPQGRSFFVAYDTDLERDFVDLETFTGGFRFSF